MRAAPEKLLFDDPELIGEVKQALDEIRKMDAQDAQEKEQGKGGENGQQRT